MKFPRGPLVNILTIIIIIIVTIIIIAVITMKMTISFIDDIIIAINIIFIKVFLILYFFRLDWFYF